MRVADEVGERERLQAFDNAMLDRKCDWLIDLLNMEADQRPDTSTASTRKANVLKNRPGIDKEK